MTFDDFFIKPLYLSCFKSFFTSSDSLFGLTRYFRYALVVYESMDNGWSRIAYDGSEAYVKTEYIASETEYKASNTDVNSNKTIEIPTQDAGENNDSTSTGGNEGIGKSAATGGGGGNSGFENYTPQPASGGGYIVNKKNGKIHNSGCKTLPNEENRIYFNSLDEVLAAGYSDYCGNCMR